MPKSRKNGKKKVKKKKITKKPTRTESPNGYNGADQALVEDTHTPNVASKTMARNLGLDPRQLDRA